MVGWKDGKRGKAVIYVSKCKIVFLKAGMNNKKYQRKYIGICCQQRNPIQKLSKYFVL